MVTWRVGKPHRRPLGLLGEHSADGDWLPYVCLAIGHQSVLDVEDLMRIPKRVGFLDAHIQAAQAATVLRGREQ